MWRCVLLPMTEVESLRLPQDTEHVGCWQSIVSNWKSAAGWEIGDSHGSAVVVVGGDIVFEGTRAATIYAGGHESMMTVKHRLLDGLLAVCLIHGY